VQTVGSHSVALWHCLGSSLHSTFADKLTEGNTLLLCTDHLGMQTLRVEQPLISCVCGSWMVMAAPKTAYFVTRHSDTCWGFASAARQAPALILVGQERAGRSGGGRRARRAVGGFCDAGADRERLRRRFRALYHRRLVPRVGFRTGATKPLSPSVPIIRSMRVRSRGAPGHYGRLLSLLDAHICCSCSHCVEVCSTDTVAQDREQFAAHGLAGTELADGPESCARVLQHFDNHVLQ